MDEFSTVKIPRAHLKSVCLYGRGDKTCKYIVFRDGNFFCCKNKLEIKTEIDKVKDMKAKGNNCKGL